MAKNQKNQKEGLSIEKDITTKNNQLSSNAELSSNNKGKANLKELITNNEYKEAGRILENVLDEKEDALKDTLFSLYDHDKKQKKSSRIKIIELLGMNEDLISKNEFTCIKTGYNTISRITDKELKETCKNLKLSILKELSPLSKSEDFEKHLKNIIDKLEDKLSSRTVKKEVAEIRNKDLKSNNNNEETKHEEETNNEEDNLLSIPPELIHDTTKLLISYYYFIFNKKAPHDEVKTKLNEIKKYIKDETLILKINNLVEAHEGHIKEYDAIKNQKVKDNLYIDPTTVDPSVYFKGIQF